MSPPPLNLYTDNFLDQRYENERFSPDREDYTTDLYETETDFSSPRSPPRSPEFYRNRKSTFARKGSSSEKSSIFDFDDWDRQTF